MQSNNCPNCDAALEAGFKFCPACGQTTTAHRISFSHLLHDGVHHVTHADKGIFHLLKHLAYRPGHVAREYIGGKRKKYMSPLSFFLIMVGLFVFTLTTFKTMEQPDTMAGLRKEVLKIQDKEVRERRMQKLDRAQKATAFMAKNSNLVSLVVATPLVSFVFFLFYRRYPYNYVEHLSANLYFAGFSALFFILIVAPAVYFIHNTIFYFAAIGSYLLFEVLYRSVAYYQFGNKKGTRHYLFALMPSLLAIVLWIVLSRWAITQYIETGFRPFF